MEKKRKKRRGLWVLCALLLALGLFAALPQGRSVAVMSVYSRMNERGSLTAEKGLRIRMPGGLSTLKKDWYPFVMTFEAGTDFGRTAGCPGARLTILYNFGAFGLQGRSSLYDPESPYFNSFYGAYLVEQPEGLFGFRETEQADGSIGRTLDLAAMAEVPRYDFSRLVLADFGLSPRDFVFDWQPVGVSAESAAAGLDGWTRIAARLRVSSVRHEKQGFVTSYLQYGAPKGACAEPFEPVDMLGIIYARPFPEEGVSVFLYALCGDEAALADCEERFLLKTRIERRDD